MATILNPYARLFAYTCESSLRLDNDGLTMTASQLSTLRGDGRQIIIANGRHSKIRNHSQTLLLFCCV